MAVAIPKMIEPSKNDIKRLEVAIGGQLPLEYLEFVHSHDGATPAHNRVAVGPDNESRIKAFIRVAEAPSTIIDVDGFPASVIPLAEDDCGNFFYINLSGTVFFWDHEIEDGDTEVASTLGEFLSGIAPFVLSSTKPTSGQVIRTWVNPSFKPEFD